MDFPIVREKMGTTAGTRVLCTQYLLRVAKVILRVHNCLFCYGDFNLISVSQFQQIPGNAVDFSLAAPCMTVFSSGSARRPIRLPLLLDEGLFALDAEPFQLDDHRYSSLPKCDITPNGNFVPCHSVPDSPWTQKMLAATTVSARILAASVDIGDNLKDFCNGFIAPAAIPPSRRQYDVGSRDDMIQLGIRFFGIGPDRLHHTVEIANGLAAPPSKVKLLWRLSLVNFSSFGRRCMAANRVPIFGSTL